MPDLVPRVRCPGCCAYPNERITRVTKRRYRGTVETEVVKTHRCKCGVVYEILAVHYATAFLDGTLDGRRPAVYPSS